MFKVFTIFIAFTANRYILPIVLMVNVSTVFAEPSFEKEVAIVPRQSIGKLADSSLECGELCLKYFNDSEFISRPISGYWIETSEFGENSRLELFTSSYTPSLTLPPIIEAMVTEYIEENSKESNQCDGYCAFYISLPFWLLCLCTTFELRGAVRRPA